MEETGKLDRGDGVRLAWARLPGRGPTVVFCPGYNSDMAGSKATALAELCARQGQAFLRFDYSGHGQSEGKFTDGTIGRWLADALAVIDVQTSGPLVIVGSSMGGWIALLTALSRPERVMALIGIAAAPDFTEDLMWATMPHADREAIMRDGQIMVPNPYGDPYPVTRALIEEGRGHLLLRAPMPIRCPVRLLHGQSDAEVPWEISLRIAERVESEDVRVILVKDGDHRLSREEDLRLLGKTLQPFLSEDGA